MGRRDRLLMEFTRLESGREGLLRRVERIPIERLEAQPKPGAWSVAQVVAHLAVAEETSLAYLRKKLHHGGHRPVTVIGALRLLTLDLALSSPVRWKAPRIIADIPPASWAEATARWTQVRAEWRNALAELPPSFASHGLFKHPVAGKLSLIQGLRFMATHVRHHSAQVERILAQP